MHIPGGLPWQSCHGDLLLLPSIDNECKCQILLLIYPYRLLIALATYAMVLNSIQQWISGS